MTDLTPKQQKFIAEYAIDSNGKQAAIRAGYAPKTAEVTASKLLRLGKVGAKVAKVRAKVQEESLARVGLEVDEVNEILAGMITTDACDLYEEGPDGTMIPVAKDKLTPRQRNSIKEITLMTGADGSGFQKITQHDRIKAIDMFYKRNGDYSEGTVNNFAIGHETQLQVNANRRRAGMAVEDDDGS